jgi:hypothetical protein
VAAAIRGLPEQPIERVLLEKLHLNADEGIRCQDANDVTFRDVEGIVQSGPPFTCLNVKRLNVTNMSLESAERRSDP